MNNSPAMQEMQIGSLGREEPLEEEMATHSSILGGEIPWTQEPGGLQSVGSQSCPGLWIVWLELGLQLWPGWKLTKGWETIKENMSSLPPPLATHQLGGVITRGVKLPGAIPDWAGALVCFPQRPPLLSA